MSGSESGSVPTEFVRDPQGYVLTIIVGAVISLSEDLSRLALSVFREIAAIPLLVADALRTGFGPGGAAVAGLLRYIFATLPAQLLDAIGPAATVVVGLLAAAGLYLALSGVGVTIDLLDPR